MINRFIFLLTIAISSSSAIAAVGDVLYTYQLPTNADSDEFSIGLENAFAIGNNGPLLWVTEGGEGEEYFQMNLSGEREGANYSFADHARNVQGIGVSENHLYLSDWNNKQIDILDKNGQLINEIDISSQMTDPDGLGIGGTNGNLYVIREASDSGDTISSYDVSDSMNVNHLADFNISPIIPTDIAYDQSRCSFWILSSTSSQIVQFNDIFQMADVFSISTTTAPQGIAYIDNELHITVSSSNQGIAFDVSEANNLCILGPTVSPVPVFSSFATIIIFGLIMIIVGIKRKELYLFNY